VIYKPAINAVLAYDCGAFHALCGSVVPTTIGGLPMLWCGECRVLAHLDLVAPHIEVPGCMVERPKGEVTWPSE